MATDENHERHRKMIEDALPVWHGYSAESWREEDGRIVAVIGWFRAIEDDPNGMFYEGDEGEITAQVVGAQQYHNERVMHSFTPEGNDVGDEVEGTLMNFEPVD